MHRLILCVSLAAAALAQNIIPSCDCSSAGAAQRRECSLSNEAEKRPPAPGVFFLKDINPRKPNRTLALPRQLGHYRLDDLTPAERTRLWTAAIEKARELWGDDWAVAYNGDKVRTQCHIHLHIGKLNSGAKRSGFLEVSSPSKIPAPASGGVWIYPSGRKFRVFLGEQTTETALVR